MAEKNQIEGLGSPRLKIIHEWSMFLLMLALVAMVTSLLVTGSSGLDLLAKAVAWAAFLFSSKPESSTMRWFPVVGIFVIAFAVVWHVAYFSSRSPMTAWSFGLLIVAYILTTAGIALCVVSLREHKEMSKSLA